MKRGGSVSGAVTLVMIFCVLCMAVFASLTLVTVRREAALTELTAQRAQAYYDADREATEKVAALAKGEKPRDVTFSGETASFAVPVGDAQKLEVRIRLTDDGCSVEKWATVYDGDWETDDSIEVWGGSDS